MSLIGISGPSFTGKTTLSNLLLQSLPIDSVIIPDFHEKVYGDLVSEGIFTEFREIQKDRDYLLIYTNRVIDFYIDMLDAYKNYPGLVVFDGTYIDLLIYSMLSLWYHYNTNELVESMLDRLLGRKFDIPLTYMTLADDANYPLRNWTNRRFNTSFRRCRKTELHYYDIFRDLNSVVTLPSSSVASCDYFIIEDLKSRGLL